MNTTKESTVKKLLIALFAIMLMAALAVFANAEGEVTTVASGYCGGEDMYYDSETGNYIGTNLVWSLDSEGTLTISGQGEMEDYEAGMAPWSSYFHLMRRVVIEEGVTSFGSLALYYDNEIESISIPASLQRIDSSSMMGCTELKAFEVSEESLFYSVDESGCLYSKDFSKLIHYPAGNTRESFRISAGTISVNAYSFYNCKYIKTLEFPDSIEDIGYQTACHCRNLETILLPNTITQIGDMAFAYTAFYEDQNNWDDNLLYLNCYLLEVNSNLTGTLTVRSGTTVIADGAAEYCEEITSVFLPESLNTIGNSAFCSCKKLEAVYIPNGVSIIGYMAFGHCTNLLYAEIPNSVTSFGGYAFWDCQQLKTVAIGTGIVKIAWQTFSDCDKLEDVYYFGSKEQWEAIEIEPSNESLNYASIHFNHTHVYENVLEVLTPATCKEPGEGIFSCACGKTVTDEIPIDPEAHDMKIGACVLETCTTDGYTPWVCSHCGKEIHTDLVPALGHQWDDGELKKPPTCSTPGIFVTTCKREGCGETIVKELARDPDAHVFKVTVYEPTCVDEGYTSHACTLCRYGYSDNIVPALGHDTPNENGDCPRCHQHIQDVPKTEPPKEEQPAPKLNFFQRIIQWFENLFAKLFGKK